MYGAWIVNPGCKRCCFVGGYIRAALKRSQSTAVSPGSSAQLYCCAWVLVAEDERSSRSTACGLLAGRCLPRLWSRKSANRVSSCSLLCLRSGPVCAVLDTVVSCFLRFDRGYRHNLAVAHLYTGIIRRYITCCVLLLW